MLLPQLGTTFKIQRLFLNGQWLPRSYAPRQSGKKHWSKGQSHKDTFSSNIIFSSSTSSHFFHLPSPQQCANEGLSESHCTGLTQINHCLRVRLPNFTRQWSWVPIRHKNLWAKGAQKLVKDVKSIMSVPSHSQLSLSL